MKWLIAVAMVFPGFALAHTFTAGECEAVANVAGLIAQAREDGVPKADLLSNLKQGMEESIGQPDTIIRDKTDITRFMELANTIYAQHMAPRDTAISAYKACIKATKGTKVT